MTTTSNLGASDYRSPRSHLDLAGVILPRRVVSFTMAR
jgi:hypothetical protein